MSDTAEIIRKLQEPFPREAIKTRAGGGNTRLSYVEAHSVIRRLNAATGGHWDFAVLREEREGDLLKATCRLTIPGLGSREHVGVQKVSERGGEDLHKGAISDALKKAATLFGVGLELYGPDYEDDAGHDHAPDDLAIVRNMGAKADARKAALHRYYAAATSPADLNVRADLAYESGLDAAVLKAAYAFHHNRLAQQLAPPASYAG
jgi:hypothetical protein